MAGAVGAGCAWAAVGGLLDAERLGSVPGRLVPGSGLGSEDWLGVRVAAPVCGVVASGGSLGSGLSLDLYEVG